MPTFRTDREAIRAGVITPVQARQARLQSKRRGRAPQLPPLHWQHALYQALLQQIPIRPCEWEYHPFSERQYRVDICYPEQHIVVEVDEWHAHRRLHQMIADRKRDRYFHRHGWQVLRYMDREIKTDLPYIIDEIQWFLGLLGPR